MYAKNCTIEDLWEALNRNNANYNDQVIWNQEPVHTPHGIKFTLKVKTNKSLGHGISFSGRQMSTACWHVHGNFFDRLFDVNPNAKVYALGKLITRFGGNWLDRNVGSQANPKLASEMCVCHLSQSYLRNHGTRMANGALIAAAPDLLEALKDLTSLYFSSPGVDVHFIKKARAAIDKAEGR